MFYSHEILTSHKYGVATVWLVAMLGPKSGMKRVNRKQILDVDVEKACQTIVNPGAPMALRLQGNLLYGVSRVYLQQCGYVLSDAQTAQHTMQMMLRTMQDGGLDPEAGKTRPEQLLLPDDPSFLPEFALPPPDLLGDLDLDFKFNVRPVDESQTLSPYSSHHSRSSSVGGLILPSSSPGVPGEFRLEGDNRQSRIGELDDTFVVGAMLEMPEPDFMFGDDGDIIELAPADSLAKPPKVSKGPTTPSDVAAMARVKKEHDEGLRAGAQLPVDEMDLDLPIYGSDLLEGEAFSPIGQQKTTDLSEIVESSSTIIAPMRRKPRTRRALVADTRTELLNKDLSSWNSDYLKNMKKATKVKIRTRTVNEAKKNAEYCVWGSGIGRIADQVHGNASSNPFAMFIGDNLFELVTGMSRRKVAGLKHDRDSGIDDGMQEEARRVRQKNDETEENVALSVENDGFFVPDDDEVELPRQAMTALNDEEIFSAMPWNISASGRGSSAVPRSGHIGVIGSVDQSRRKNRLVSASPLLGRGRPENLEALQNLPSEDDYGFEDEFALPQLSSDSPGQDPPTQSSIRVQEALAAEGNNFLAFVSEAITEKRNRADAAGDIDVVTFEELLPLHENNKMVACQGLMMALALGNEGLLDVQQLEHFGDIELRLTEKAKAMQVIDISDGEPHEHEEDTVGNDLSRVEDVMDDEEMREDDGHDGHEGEPGHFQEQLAAGITALEGDDSNGSLYAD